MKRRSYIQGTAAISPQESFSGTFTPQLARLEDRNLLRVKEPDYRDFIAANSLRRMSRVLKMGLTTALKCLQNSNVAVPDAIITGTGKGSLHDTERFLHDIRQYKETALNPTPFIQSTYNSVNGLIALQTRCTQYNNTFVHRGFSFEHALLDSMMQLNEGAARHVLAGAFEEISDEHFYIKSRIGFWKEELTQPADMLTSGTPGTISGEGSAFFVLSTAPSDVHIAGLKMLYKPTQEQVSTALGNFLREHQLQPEDIGLLITGRNGDANFDFYYQELIAQHFPQTPELPFKQLCGEYDTASAFALWLAVERMRAGGPEHVLIYNQFFGEQHSFVLLGR